MAKRKEKIVAKDFGSITVPTSWEQITLGQFVKLMKLQEEEGKEEPSIVHIMAVLTGTDKKYIYSLPSDFSNSIMSHFFFLI